MSIRPRRTAVVPLALLAFLFPFHSPGCAQSRLTPEQVEEDLNQLLSELEGRAAYLTVNQPDYRSAIAKIREANPGGMEVVDLGAQLSKVIGLLVDGHAGVQGVRWQGLSMPFLFRSYFGRSLAIRADRSAFIDPERPFIRSIDGKDIREWLSMASAFAPKGSDAYVTAAAHGLLGALPALARFEGVVVGDTVEIELASDDGRDTRTMDVALTRNRGAGSVWPDSQSGIIEGNIGYLRIPSWRPGATDEVDQWMQKFRSTDGLIIDLRGNGGGNRNQFYPLFPYLRGEADPPVVANAAKLRLNEAYTSLQMLTSRQMQTEDWDGWDPAERRAIAEFKKGFRPEWPVPEKGFSDWHYWVLSRKTNPAAYHYENPVIFLMDGGCFSASDVVLSAVKGLPNITLLGTPSMGGSGAALATTLKNSNLQIRLSSMVSFQKTGRLFDTRGVEPDIYLEPLPEFYLRGGRDVVLEAAVERIESTGLVRPQDTTRASEQPDEFAAVLETAGPPRP